MRRCMVFVGAAIMGAMFTASPSHAIWNQPYFIVGGYGVGGDWVSLTRLHNAGLDIVVPDEPATPPVTTAVHVRQIVARMDSLRTNYAGFDMQEFVYEELPHQPNTLFKNDPATANETAIINELKPASGLNSLSVAGWMIWDEPPSYYLPPDTLSTSQVAADIHKMTSIVRDSGTTANTHHKLAYVNMFPIQGVGAYCDANCADTLAAYHQYLGTFLSQFDSDPLPAPILSFDNYPFETPSAHFRLYFQQLAISRDKAAQYSRSNYRVPLWSIVQASPRLLTPPSTYYLTPTMNQIRWQTYVSLAYGAKSIWYWRNRPIDFKDDNGVVVGGYGASLLTKNGSFGPFYTPITALNAELHGLGPTLMRLNSVATYHTAANGFLLPASEDTLGEVYNIVSSLMGTSLNALSKTQGMVGYLKAHHGGDDYLFIVNKDTLVTQSFNVGLGNPADTVYRYNKTNGQLVFVAANTSSFQTSSIVAGGGELYKVVDKVFEYIPNVNKIVRSGDRTYYLHARGAEMVNYATGRRVHYRDGGALTPIVDIALTSTNAYLALNNGTTGNVCKTSLDLDLPGILFYPSTPQGSPVNSIVYASGKFYLGETILPGATGRMTVLNTTGTILGTRTTSTPVYRVMPAAVPGHLFLATGSGISKNEDFSPFNTIASWSDSPVRAAVAMVQNATSVYAALDNGATGQVVRLSQSLALLNAWTDTGSYPRCFDVDLGTSVLIASSNGLFNGAKFTRRSLDLLSSQATRILANPRRVTFVADTLNYLATAAGVLKVRNSDMASQYSQSAAVDDGPLRHEPIELRVQNPITAGGHLRLVLTRAARLELSVFDLQGRQVSRIRGRNLGPGVHDLDWPAEARHQGIYFVRAAMGDWSVTKKVTVVE